MFSRVVSRCINKNTQHGFSYMYMYKQCKYLCSSLILPQQHRHQGLAHHLKDRHSGFLNSAWSQSRPNTRRMSSIKEGCLVGIGNPLLDITVSTDQAFLKKYDLQENNAILAEEKHMPLFEEMVEKYQPTYVAGGATQNSIRVAQWILHEANATTFFGCVGNDKEADIQRKEGKEDGVNVRYQTDPAHPTGICGAVITGENRSLVANLGAANHLTMEHFKEPDNWALIEKASVFYIGGFVFTVSPLVIDSIANHACDCNKVLVMNLSAPFLIPFFVDPKIDIMPKIDILFGNYDEATELCKQLNIETGDIKHMALKVSELPKKNTKRARVVVFTGGADPTIMAEGGKVIEYPIIKVTKDEIKDTNGCGDSFVGGFLSQLVQGKPTSESLRCGNYCANVILKHWGCTYPKPHNFK